MSTVVERTERLTGTPAAPRWRGRLHLFALALAVPTAAALVWHNPAPEAALYAVALVALFAVSTAYHLLPLSPARRHLLRRADHATIYLYIAAAYGPYCHWAVRGALGWVVLGVVWTGAGLGVAVKGLDFRRTHAFSGVLYLVLGWTAVITLPRAGRVLDGVDLGLLVTMGALYTAGAAVLARRRPDPAPLVFGYHEVWHAAVVLATACYVVVVWRLTGPSFA